MLTANFSRFVAGARCCALAIVVLLVLIVLQRTSADPPEHAFHVNHDAVCSRIEPTTITCREAANGLVRNVVRVEQTASDRIASARDTTTALIATKDAADAQETPDLIVPKQGIWISRDELITKEIVGRTWARLQAMAERPLGPPTLYDQNSNHDIQTLTKAMVGVRLNDERHLKEVRKVIRQLSERIEAREPLAVSRNLTSYVIAADLVGLDAEDDEHFRDWLRQCLATKFEGRTLVEIHELRPNNWGAMAGAARISAAAFLGDRKQIEQAALVLQGYLGDREAYRRFRFAENRSWQFDPSAPVAINPAGAMKEGILIDGAQPEEMRRASDLLWPPPENDYPWEGLQGLVVQAELLHRQGYDPWSWSEMALYRAVRFLYSARMEPLGDDRWVIPLVNTRCQSTFPVDADATFGKNMGWTLWTHSSREALE